MPTTTASKIDPVHLARQGKPVTLWTGQSPLTGQTVRAIGRLTNNRKTGRAFGVSFYTVDSVGAGCSLCPLQGDGCYAEMGHTGIQSRQLPTMAAPVLPRSRWHQVIGGEFVRFGIYGDPATVPFRVLDAIAMHARGTVGYTHLWRIVTSDYARLLQASCESFDDLRAARNMGYRAFLAVLVGKPRDAINPDKRDDVIKTMKRAISAEKLSDVVVCPHYATDERIQCRDCAVNCSGTSHGYFDVIIPSHGARAGSSKFQRLPIVT